VDASRETNLTKSAVEMVKRNLKSVFGLNGRYKNQMLGGAGNAGTISSSARDIAHNAAQTASVVFGGVGEVRSSVPSLPNVSWMRIWLFSHMLGQCQGPNVLLADSTGSGGGDRRASNGDSGDNDASQGGRGGGAGGENTGNGASSEQSMQNKNGEDAKDAVSPNEAEIAEVPTHNGSAVQALGRYAASQSSGPTGPLCGLVTTPLNRGEETESDSEFEFESGEHSTFKTGDSGEEDDLICAKESRARVISAIRSEFAGRRLPFGESTEQALDKIFSMYQSYDCILHHLMCMDGEKIIVQAQYKGEDRCVLQPQGPLLPGGRFSIMISARWRKKERAKNDPAFRHSSIALQMSQRTKHQLAEYVAKIQPIRLFAHGASMALVSQEPILKRGSMVLGFTSIPHADKVLWDNIWGRDNTTGNDEKLCDGLRVCLRQLVFAIYTFNQKGLALGQAAVLSARIADDGAITFLDLSQSTVFPETSDPHSRQAQQATTFLNRQNTSLSWAYKEPAKINFHIHCLSDATVLELQQNARQSGLAVQNAVPDHEPRNKAIKKDAAFQKDQACVAQALARVLRFSTSPPSTEQCNSLTKEVLRIANLKKKDKVDLMITALAGAAGHGTGHLGHAWKRCADFVIQSLAKTDAYSSVADHLFITTYIPQPSIASLIYGAGWRFEDTAFKLPEGWKQVSGQSILNQPIPAVVVRHESDVKGVGLISGRAVRAKELVFVYLGELVCNAETRPSSRMVVKQTVGDVRQYCFGVEDLLECVRIGPALGPYANAPGPGERPNCDLDQYKRFICEDETGKKYLGFPAYSIIPLAEGVPYLWRYKHFAGRGRNLR
jgi:hypothetical protein